MSTVRALEPESEREMVITRLVQAPRRLVWQAFTSAEHLARGRPAGAAHLPRHTAHRNWHAQSKVHLLDAVKPTAEKAGF